MSGVIPKQRAVVLTLTSVPPRFSNLPRKFRAIEDQTEKPDRVELNIPETYRRFPGEIPSLPELPDWVEVRRCATDFGPATKVLPTVERWRGHNVDLLVCDDDRIPDARWIERLKAARRDRPDDIITERGWNIEERFGIRRTDPDRPRAKPAPRHGRTLSYRLKRIASLNTWHPPRRLFEQPGYVDIFEGFLGAMIPAGAIPPEAFDIPDIIWTVDDVWLSGQAHVNGTRVWAHAIPRPVYPDARVDKLASLRDFVHHGHGRQDADRYAVEYLRENLGAWP